MWTLQPYLPTNKNEGFNGSQQNSIFSHSRGIWKWVGYFLVVTKTKRTKNSKCPVMRRMVPQTNNCFIWKTNIALLWNLDHLWSSFHFDLLSLYFMSLFFTVYWMSHHDTYKHVYQNKEFWNKELACLVRVECSRQAEKYVRQKLPWK